MDSITRFFSGTVPHPAPRTIQRLGQYRYVVQPGAELPEDFPDAPAPEIMLKESGSVTAYSCCGGCRFVKISKDKGLFHALRRTFRVPRLFRSFAGAETLRQAGFRTPGPVAAAVRYRFGVLPVQQMLITEQLPGDTVFIDTIFRDADPEQVREEFLRLVRFAARLHQAGFRHGDMSLRNFYRIDHDADFGMIDLDGLLHYPAAVPRKAAAAELARLAASAFKLMKPEVDRTAWIKAMLDAYRQAGGIQLAPEELHGTVTRLMKHRYHGPWNPLKNP